MIWVWTRHGNTFGPADPVVYVGKHNDLPLVAYGIEQAHRLADAWLAFGILPSAIYCGTLLRLKQTAHIVCSRLGWPSSAITYDARLDELDYGAWTGRSRDQVVQTFGEASVRAWEMHSTWPTQARWTSSPQIVCRELAEWMGEVRALQLPQAAPGPILAISSNGRLRYALAGVPNAFESRQLAQKLSMRTGHVGVTWEAAGGAQVISWNAPPAVALGCLPQLGESAYTPEATL